MGKLCIVTEAWSSNYGIMKPLSWQKKKKEKEKEKAKRHGNKKCHKIKLTFTKGASFPALCPVAMVTWFGWTAKLHI